MEKQRIYSIAEAFSQQPSFYRITEKEPDNRKESHIKEIKPEIITLKVGGISVEYDVYVGYSWDGNKRFQYFANSVNVCYKKLKP